MTDDLILTRYDGPNYNREARRIIRELKRGCGDNSCRFAPSTYGAGTNGGCRCSDKIEWALCKAWQDGRDGVVR